MSAFSAPEHALHAPAFEIFRGDRVPCFESPRRVEVVLAELVARGHEIRRPASDSRALLAQVHTPTAWAATASSTTRPSRSRACALTTSDYLALGARLARLKVPTVLVLEGGYAAAELGANAANVLEAFADA